jgi:ubiquinone/menaquinone biosynthesis C-methylase UbiE
MSTDESNKAYWSELSGSRAAYKLKIVQGDPMGAEKFDDWFFWYYPYLDNEQFIPWSSLDETKVLEIGLGYGSVGRRIAETGANYTGLDISSGPTRYLAQTVSQEHANVIQSSALCLPFKDNSFDTVISIGCLHHTGDIALALRECRRVLKPNGQLIIMVYYAFSYKRWITAPRETWHRHRSHVSPNAKELITNRGNFWYDRHLDGTAAPQTEFVSRQDLVSLLKGFEGIVTNVVNIDNIQDLLPPKLQRKSLDRLRQIFLNLRIFKRVGLDLYVKAAKTE